MKIKTLLTKIKKEENINLYEELKVKEYINVMDKRKNVLDVISMCTEFENGYAVVDRLKLAIYFDMRMLAIYTNLDVSMDFEEIIAQYDELCKHGLLNNIKMLFKNDYESACTMLELELEHVLKKNSFEAQIASITNNINCLIENVNDKISELNLGGLVPKNMDLSQILSVLSTLQ